MYDLCLLCVDTLWANETDKVIMAWHGIVNSHPWNSGTIAKWNNLFSVIYNPVGFGTKSVVYSNSKHMFDRSFVRTSSALFCLPERPLSRPTKDFWKIFKSTVKASGVRRTRTDVRTCYAWQCEKILYSSWHKDELPSFVNRQ